MADTGAPYFIPYVEPTDLVRDYPAADEASADAIAAALDAIPVLAGIGSNVVQTVKTNTFSSTASGFVDVPDLAVTITPSTDSAKVLVIISMFQLNPGNTTVSSKLVRGSTDIFIGDAGNTDRSTFGDNRAQNGGQTMTFVGLDSPNSDTATTYKVQIKRQGSGTFRVNEDAFSNAKYASTITAIEVAA